MFPPWQECDDANSFSGDGCSKDCLVERPGRPGIDPQHDGCSALGRSWCYNFQIFLVVALFCLPHRLCLLHFSPLPTAKVLHCTGDSSALAVECARGSLGSLPKVQSPFLGRFFGRFLWISMDFYGFPCLGVRKSGHVLADLWRWPSSGSGLLSDIRSR